MDIIFSLIVLFLSTALLISVLILAIRNAYNRGFTDGMKAEAFHKELCKEEQTDERH